MTVFYAERKTMTRWRKVGNTFEPINLADFEKIGRDPQDVLAKGFFTGPYTTKKESK